MRHTHLVGADGQQQVAHLGAGGQAPVPEADVGGLQRLPLLQLAVVQVLRRSEGGWGGAWGAAVGVCGQRSAWVERAGGAQGGSETLHSIELGAYLGGFLKYLDGPRVGCHRLLLEVLRGERGEWGGTGGTTSAVR